MVLSPHAPSFCVKAFSTDKKLQTFNGYVPIRVPGHGFLSQSLSLPSIRFCFRRACDCSVRLSHLTCRSAFIRCVRPFCYSNVGIKVAVRWISTSVSGLLQLPVHSVVLLDVDAVFLDLGLRVTSVYLYRLSI